MLFFHNPGLIDLEAIRTMGASIKAPGSFGRFGTGFKYGTAAVLRGGGSITVYRGADSHEIHTEDRLIRGQPFEVVCMDGESMGFTTQLGRDWQPWMAFREFACNARDDGGDFDSTEQGRTLADFTTQDGTVVVVDWDEMDKAWLERDQLFLEGEPLFENSEVRILPGPSNYLFYRGVRAFTLQHPAQYTYDLIGWQMLTEDRTLYGEWSARSAVRTAMLEWDDAEAVRVAIAPATKDSFEGGVDFSEGGQTPSRAFLDAALVARESRAKHLNETAKKMLLANMRAAAGKECHYGGSVQEFTNDAFGRILSVLSDLGISFSSNQAFIITEEMPEGVDSMAEGGNVYMRRAMLDLPPRDLALTIILRWAEAKGMNAVEEVVSALGGLLLDASEEFDGALKLIAEEEEYAK